MQGQSGGFWCSKFVPFHRSFAHRSVIISSAVKWSPGSPGSATAGLRITLSKVGLTRSRGAFLIRRAARNADLFLMKLLDNVLLLPFVASSN
jgi:glycerol-3-phosphate O-acyltransferase